MNNEALRRQDLLGKLTQAGRLMEKMESLAARTESIYVEMQPKLEPIRPLWRERRLPIVVASVILGLAACSTGPQFLLVSLLLALALVLAAGWLGVVDKNMRLSILCSCAAASLVAMFVFNAMVAAWQASLIMLASVTVAVLVVVEIRDRRVPAKNEEVFARNEEVLALANSSLARELAPINRDFYACRKEFIDCGYFQLVPERYLDSRSIYALARIVHDGRATTITGAINAYVGDLRYREARQIAQAQLEAQERTRRAVVMGTAINAGLQTYHASRTRNTIRSESENLRRNSDFNAREIMSRLDRLR